MEEMELTAETTEDEVEVTETEDVVGDADNDGESSAGFSEDADSSDSADDKDGEEPEKKPAESDSKPWKNEKNAQEAAKRREAERQAEIKKARTEAVIEALNGINPFTHEKIEDEADVEEYLTMKEIEKSGKDPVTDYSRFLKNRTKEQEKAAKAEASQEEWIQKDREDFQSKHPDVKLDELIGDDMFRTFATGKVGRIPMTKIYADYQSFEKLSEERAKTKAAQILANSAATPGKLSGQTPPPKKSIKDMSMEEFRKFDEQVQRGEIKLE